MFLLFLILFIMSIGMAWAISASPKGSTFVKLFFVTILIYISLSIFFSFNNFKGWPIDKPLPDTFQLDWVIIDEPIAQDDPGVIYLWIRSVDIEDYCPNILLCITEADKGAPRAYKIPYSQEKHEDMLAIIEELQKGTIMLGQRPMADVGENKDGDEPSEEIEFFRLPPLRDRIQK